MSFFRALSCTLLTAGLSVVVATPAEAAVYTSNGVRCTIVGTAGDDRLVGTTTRDVICGQGGDDSISGRGGDDLVDAGAGWDVVSGGAGHDRLLGGTGVDELSGNDGADLLNGGDSGDTLSGGAGSDALRGTAGNDDLTGGPGADSLVGGDGTNWCTVEASDTRSQCVHDRSAPTTGGLRLSVATVDVTEQSQTVEVRMRLLDDTGIQSVQVGLQDFETSAFADSRFATLSNGTVRDGSWHTTLQVPRWIEPADYEVGVSVRDRVNRSTSHTWADPTLRVVDRTPDRSAPVVASLASPTSSTTVDVRTSGRTVPVRARLTDTVSGIGDVNFCPMRPLNGYYSNLGCAVAEKVSGTLNDGWWEGELFIPKGSAGGDWNVSIWVTDRAHPGETHYWMGPDDYRTSIADFPNEPRYHQLPNGAGRFRVIGTSDSNAPVIASLAATPNEVNTLAAPARITIKVEATDVEGVTSVGAELSASTNDASAPSFRVGEFTLDSGTPKNGIWQAELVLPQGTPPDTYTFQAWVEDASHWRSYVSASSPHADSPGQQLLPGDPKVVVVPAP